MKCPNCGKKMSKKAESCKKCDYNVKTGTIGGKPKTGPQINYFMYDPAKPEVSYPLVEQVDTSKKKKKAKKIKKCPDCGKKIKKNKVCKCGFDPKAPAPLNYVAKIDEEKKKFCPKCGKKLKKKGTKVCKCGYDPKADKPNYASYTLPGKVEEKEAPTKYCKSCGRKLNKKGKLCKCVKKLNKKNAKIAKKAAKKAAKAAKKAGK